MPVDDVQVAPLMAPDLHAAVIRAGDDPVVLGIQVQLADGAGVHVLVLDVVLLGALGVVHTHALVVRGAEDLAALAARDAAHDVGMRPDGSDVLQRFTFLAGGSGHVLGGEAVELGHLVSELGFRVYGLWLRV